MLLGSIAIYAILGMIMAYACSKMGETTKRIEVIHPNGEVEEVVEIKTSVYFNIGRQFEEKYGSWNITVKRFCEIDKGPRETNVLAELPDGMKLCSYGYHPTLVGHLENLLKTGTPSEIDDFNAGRLSYVEEKGKETLTIMDNSSVLERGTKQVEALRQGFEEIAVSKSPELQWKKEYDEI